MKKISITCTLFFFAAALILRGDPLAGDWLNIGGSNELAYGTNNGFFGTNNWLDGDACLIIGYSNTGTFALSSDVIVGYNNYGMGGSSSVVGESNTFWLGDASVVGSGNTVMASQSAVIGTGNTVQQEYPNLLTNSLVVGLLNSSNQVSGFTAGTNNVADGESFVMGHGLTASTSPLIVVVGKYNQAPTANQLFVIGNGTAVTSGSQTTITPKNALEVYDNGAIKIPKRQGDIRMGVFGNGGTD